MTCRSVNHGDGPVFCYHIPMEKRDHPYTLPPERLERESATFEALSWAQAEEILAETEIHGSPFHDKELTTDELAEAGLGPKYFKHARGVDVFLSAPYVCDKTGRLAVVGYLKKQRPGAGNDHPVARTFYTSSSQALWRYLPDYQEAGEGELYWYGKGYNETSLQLPIEMQEALAEVERLSPERPRPKNRSHLFAGTAKSLIDVAKEYAERQHLTYYGSVVQVGKFIPGQYFAEAGEKKAPPERLVFQEQSKWPDLSGSPERAWSRQTDMYGKVDMEVFPSKDGELRYLFCRDENGRAWIGSIEVANAKLTSTGLAREWVNTGDMTTPLAEYASQAGSWGGRDLDQRGYVDMFENYLSKSSYIIQYLHTVKRRMPEVESSKTEVMSKREMAELALQSASDIPSFLRMLWIHNETIDEALRATKGQDANFTSLTAALHLVQKGRIKTSVLPELFGIRSKMEALLAEAERW